MGNIHKLENILRYPVELSIWMKNGNCPNFRFSENGAVPFRAGTAFGA
jgi:hypothetical protein